MNIKTVAAIVGISLAGVLMLGGCGALRPTTVPLSAPVEVQASAPTDLGVSADYSGFPGAAKLADGSLLMVWRQGSAHVSIDGRIMASRSFDGGKTCLPRRRSCPARWTTVTRAGQRLSAHFDRLRTHLVQP